MQISHILLPVDGSVHSDHATDYAIKLARMSDAHVTIVSCYEWLGHMLDIPESLVRELKANYQKQALDILEKTSLLLDEERIRHKKELIAGSPGSVLAGMAKTKEYDLIIMGSHGHSDIAGLFLGSVTHKVLNTIYCPVLVVP